MIYESRYFAVYTLLSSPTNFTRVKDWLYGVVHELPVASDYADAETPAEELRSVYHAVTWQRHLGGAGITPRIGKWKNIASAFPLHDRAANAELLRKMSRSVTMTDEDLDAIRALFGEKVSGHKNEDSTKLTLADGILFCVYPILFIISGCPSRMGSHLLVIFRAVLYQLRTG
jgi:hypothetical protein